MVVAHDAWNRIVLAFLAKALPPEMAMRRLGWLRISVL